MAKKTRTEQVDVEAVVVKTKKPAVKKSPILSEQKSGEISIQKYFQLYNSSVHIYDKAYLGEQFRCINKTKEAWDAELKNIMEGKK